jgi:uncharacterized membrane protein
VNGETRGPRPLAVDPDRAGHAPAAAPPADVRPAADPRPAQPAAGDGAAGEVSAADQSRTGRRRFVEPARVLPSLTDPVVRGASAVLGGPWGRRGVVGRRAFWTPLRFCLLLAVVLLALSWVQKSPCRSGDWSGHKQYTHMCYSDVVPLFFTEHLNEGAVPYRDHPVEYPVLTGGFMYVASTLSKTWDAVSGGTNAVRSYFDVTALLLAACALVAVWATTRVSGRRPWDAAMVALSPVVFVHAFTNWDLFAVALASLALVAWQARRPFAAGVLVGLGAAAKLYPVLFLGPLLLLCWRTGRWREFGRTAGGAALSWTAVNLPVALLYPDAWRTFFRLNTTRPADPDTLWNVLQHTTGTSLDEGLVQGQTPVVLNTATLLVFGVALAGIAVLAMVARRRPRLPQLLFLVVAAFLLSNKVWSPQYSLWLVPLGVLARPSWRAYLAWQATEAFLWFPRMYWYLGTDNKGVDVGWFLLAVVVRDIAVLAYCALVVRDILRPERDVVRNSPEHSGAGPAGGRRGGVDDPAGGVFDGAPDEVRWVGWPPVPARPDGPGESVAVSVGAGDAAGPPGGASGEHRNTT